MSTSVRNPVLSGRKSVSPPSKNSTRNSDLASDEQSDDDSIEDSDESDSDDISALNNDSLYSADTYAGSYGPDAVSNPRNSTSGTTVSPMQSNRSSSTRRTEPQAKSRAYADEEQGRGLETIDEEGSDEDDGKRDDDDEEDSEDDDSSEGSYDSGSSENTSEDDYGSGSGSDTGSSGSSGSDDDSNMNKMAPSAVNAQPMDVLNAIACSLWEPVIIADDESSRDGQSVSSSEEDDDEILEGEGTVGLGAFSRQERERATTVFHYCATGDGKHLSEVQFGVALALLGQTEKKETLKNIFDDLAISDGLASDGFYTALNRLRAKGNEDEALNRIKHAFDALYEGTCLNDDQKDFTGQRFIYAADFRLLLTVTGEDTERLTDEEANELLKDCKPIYPKVINPHTGNEEDDGIAVSVLRGRIFFEQYRAMLLDICP